MWKLMLCTIFVYVTETDPSIMNQAEISAGTLHSGRMSIFGGPTDTFVRPHEGLALYQKTTDRPSIFLPYQPRGTTGLARRLNPNAFYISMRWNYSDTPKSFLRNHQAIVINPKNGRVATAWPADWGPNQRTGRNVDLSPGIARYLGLQTDNIVEVVVPKPNL